MNILLCVLQFTVSRIQGLCWNFWWMASRWGQRWNTPLVPSYKAPGSSLFKLKTDGIEFVEFYDGFGVMWEDGWWCSAETGFIKIKRALNLIYGICINTLSKKALLTTIPRFSVSFEEKMLIFHANAVLWEGAATNTCPRFSFQRL